MKQDVRGTPGRAGSKFAARGGAEGKGLPNLPPLWAQAFGEVTIWAADG